MFFLNLLHLFFIQNVKLKEEQDLLIKHLLKQAKDADMMFAGEEIKNKDDVIVSMHEKWARQRQREKQIEGALTFDYVYKMICIWLGL